MRFPKITIVTPSFEQGDYLEATILSILEQNYPNLEYVIIDGGSTDNSVEIIRKYKKYLSYWVSEKDNGQTHAINKGFKIATGSIVNWINSDDLLEPDALLNIASAVKEQPQFDVYFGDYRAIDASGRTLYSRKSAPYCLNCLFWGRQLSSQPSVFFRRQSLLDHGFLNESKHFCMDIEFWVRLARKHCSFCQIKRSIGVTRVHGDAKTTNLQHVLHKEHKLLVRENGSLKYLSPESKFEDIYFDVLNHLWRGVSSFNRVVYRRDFSFGKASKARDSLHKGSVK